MDIFSHWLWSMALTRGKISWKISGPMGVLPDLLAFVPASLIAMMQGVERTRITDESVTSDLPIAWEIYQWTHSFFMVLVLFGAAYFILQRRGHENPKNMAWVFVIPWLFHIFLDIPGHTIDFFPTPFLHPFSDFMIDGFSWSNWWFFWPQVVILGVFWWYILKREKEQSGDELLDNATLV